MLAVEFENVSKIYKLYAKPVDRLKEAIFRRPYCQTFWALEAISFSLTGGQSLGIMGDNGAGKSTLLKIMAGTLRQTSGTINIKGRVSALLELGAGFHPEFTGRQNIYLNASLLGLREEEIKTREGSIIEFSELGSFIDHPVKVYSSGMYVRLAFAIATSVDPDILIIDEALSVGDQRFQKKCIDRMMDFRQSGKTIIFCSHSMYHISELCETAMWIKGGRVERLGDNKSIIAAYEKWAQRNEQTAIESETLTQDDLPVRIEAIHVKNSRDEIISQARKGDDLIVELEIQSREACHVHIGVGFRGISGNNIFGVSTRSEKLEPVFIEKTRRVNIVFPAICLIGGAYQVFGTVLDNHALHIYDLKLSPMIDIQKEDDFYGSVYMEHQWQIHR